MPNTGKSSGKPKREPLTRSQHSALVAIRDHVREQKISPTLDEIAVRLQVTKNAAKQSVDLLTEKGYLAKAPGRYRNLIVTPRGSYAANRKPEAN